MVGSQRLHQGGRSVAYVVIGFLVYFESELLKRAHKKFTFVNGRYESTPIIVLKLKYLHSIGNYFLAAAQGFFRSLPSAIFLFSSITNSQANILPVIVTNHTVTIAAELVRLHIRIGEPSRANHPPKDNGEKLVGQCEISHPVPGVSTVVGSSSSFAEPDPYGSPVETQRQNVMFEPEGKSTYEALASRISSK